MPVFASRLPSLSTPRLKWVVPAPAVFFSVPVLLNWPGAAEVVQEVGVGLHVEDAVVVEGRRAGAHVAGAGEVPGAVVVGHAAAGRVLHGALLTFIVAPAAKTVVPVPVIVPPVQLEAGLGPLIVNGELPASTPLDWLRTVRRRRRVEDRRPAVDVRARRAVRPQDRRRAAREPGRARARQ